MYQSLNIYNGAMPKIILKAFDTMVVPILTYGCEVWVPYVLKHNIDFLLKYINSKMENFHTRVCTNILELKKVHLI